MGANVKWATLADIVRNGGELGIVCGCGRRATLSGRQVLALFQGKGWDTRRHPVCGRLKCSACGNRPSRGGISKSLDVHLESNGASTPGLTAHGPVAEEALLA